ncbi:hypothetical protein KIL84_017743 [Mauremys mutica]|uniref:MAM domain-containing protein n=1 Tax=Mauremys mutica TaxID=74926 RepID=A0A9D3X1Q0_9SAUR|nr:hypothetical protein KIL84_017743 [Mauremys mutica]
MSRAAMELEKEPGEETPRSPWPPKTTSGTPLAPCLLDRRGGQRPAWAEHPPEGMSTLESPTNIPSLPPDFSAWNLTWVMKDSSPFFPHRGQHVFDCNFELPCELEYSPPLKDKENHNRTWHRVSAEKLNLLDGPERDYSEDSPRGSFLFLNTSESMSPIILSPWLRSSSEQCTIQVSVYRHLQQSGDYIARLLPADESSSEILLTPSQEKHGKKTRSVKQICIAMHFDGMGRMEEPLWEEWVKNDGHFEQCMDNGAWLLRLGIG